MSKPHFGVALRWQPRRTFLAILTRGNSATIVPLAWPGAKKLSSRQDDSHFGRNPAIGRS
jgi:hypothetical protein